MDTKNPPWAPRLLPWAEGVIAATYVGCQADGIAKQMWINLVECGIIITRLGSNCTTAHAVSPGSCDSKIYAVWSLRPVQSSPVQQWHSGTDNYGDPEGAEQCWRRGGEEARRDW